MFATLQSERWRLTAKLFSTWAALLLVCSVCIVLGVRVSANAQDSPKVPAPASVQTKQQPEKQAAPLEAKSTDHPSDAKSPDSLESGNPEQAKLLADTRRLRALSRELQAEILNSKPDTLSLTALKKLDELQKLAAVVKAEIGTAP